MRVLRSFAAIFGAILAVIPWHISEAQTLDFTSVNLPPGGCTDASAYLATFGITFVPVSSGATAQICNATGSSIFPTSSPNFFFIGPAVTNTNVSGDLVFSTPVAQISFVTTAVSPVTSVPAWDAEAYDASNTLLSSVGEQSLYPGPGALSFTLPGPGITRFHFDAFNSAARTFNAPPIDHITLTESCTATPPKQFTQLQPPWNGKTYDHTSELISDGGCSLTALTMAIDAADGATAYDPGTLNDLLTNHPGAYTPFDTVGCPNSKGCGGLFFNQAVAAASLGSLKFYGKSIDSQADPPGAADFLDNALCNVGSPVVVGVTGSRGSFPGHYVLVTGKQGTTYAVIDPGSSSNTNTTLDTFGHYLTRGYVSDPAGDLSRLEIAIDTGDMLVTDPAGRQTGLLSSSIVQNIPQSYYFRDALDDDAHAAFTIGSVRTVGILQPSQGSYQVSVFGTSLATYSLQMLAVANDGTAEAAVLVPGVANIGSSSTFQIQYSSTPGSTPTVATVATFASTLADISNSLALGLIDNQGIANALSSKINAASAAAGRGDYNTAVNNLNAFLNQVNAQAGKHITGITPQVLLSDANSLIAQMP